MIECSLASIIWSWSVDFGKHNCIGILSIHYNSPFICLSKLADCRSDFLLDRLERCLKLFASSESTSCHTFASQFGLAIFYAKTPKSIANTAFHTRLFIWMKHRPVTHGQQNRRKGGLNFVMVGRTPTLRTATTWMVTAVGGLVGGRVRVRECVRVCVCVCVRAWVMCFPYTIISFHPAW